MKKLFFALIVSFSFLIFSGFNDSTTDSTLNESEILINNQTLTISNTSSAGNPWLVLVLLEGIPYGPSIGVGGTPRTFTIPENNVDVNIEFQQIFGVTDPDGIPGSALGNYSQTTGELGEPICANTYSFNSPDNDFHNFNCFITPDN